MIRRGLLVLCLTASACSDSSPIAETTEDGASNRTTIESFSADGSTSAQPASTTTSTSQAPVGPEVTPDSTTCPDAGTPWISELTAPSEPLLEHDGVRVEAVVYPHPEYDGRPWSQWGQGIVAPDGRFYSAIGDHHGVDGNSYVYEYDPEARRLTLVADVGGVIGHRPGSWGYGKVHGAMVPGPCGIYFSTYWGSRRNLAFDDHYRGDHLMLLDPAARTTADLSVILAGHGVPSLASSAQHGLIYAEAVDPSQTDDTGWFVVLDTTGAEVFRTDMEHVGFRSIAVDAQGRGLFSIGDGALAVYQPGRNEVTGTVDGLPGAWLRAATRPAPDGTVYGVTREPDALFALAADGTVRPLGKVDGYTASLAMSPDGTTLYYVPDAHGSSWEADTPLIAVDTASGRQSVVARLNPSAEAELGLTLGGSYNLALSPDGATLYIGMNAGSVGSGETFGTVVLLVVHLER